MTAADLAGRLPGESSRWQPSTFAHAVGEAARAGAVTQMPFGQFKGVPLGDVPDDYLAWLRNLDLREPLRAAVQREWGVRFGAPGRPPPIDADVSVMAEEVAAAGFRQLAKLHHPDQGGATRTMQLLNAAVDWRGQSVRSR